jgi:dolichol-phosphate mannosyltransferase
LAIALSCVVPIYNDGYLAEDFCKEFESVFKAVFETEELWQYAEIVFVNDGSSDDSFGQLRALCQRYPFVGAIDLSRNFGQHVAVSCGYRHARGQYVGVLNVDMEDHPSQLAVLLEALKSNDADFSGGRYRRRKRKVVSAITSKAFSGLLNLFTGYSVPLDMATARVVTRRFVDAYNQLTEKSRYIPGLEAWLGFRRVWTTVEHRPRSRGRSSYNFRRRLVLAVDSIISFSDLPLKLAVLFGASVAALGFLMTATLIIGKHIFKNFQVGFTSTISTIVLMGGVQIMVIGVASLYIGRILREVQDRPLYVVRETIMNREQPGK